MSHTLIKNLQHPDKFAHNTSQFIVYETHSSLVLTTGQYVYKIKKPVNFGFLDYSSLEKRKHFCQREVEFNCVLAKHLYLEVVAIYGDEHNPSFEPNGEQPFEYAVKMQQFPQKQLFSQLLEENKITPDIIKKLAYVIADFHQKIIAANANTTRGDAIHVHKFAMDNFIETIPLLKTKEDIAQLKKLEQLTQACYQKNYQALQARKDNGMVRRCHGDMHLNNIVMLDEQPVIFDCIEFNEDFIWTDTMGDLGFILMDLNENQKPELASLLLNHYLELTGDYSALEVLPYFCAYRAMVRAKVDQIRLAQAGISPNEQQQIKHHYQMCLNLVADYLQPKQPQLLITHGLCGSGKSTLATSLATSLEAILLRSDVERKRLANLELTSDSQSALYDGLYKKTITDEIYQHLAELAENIIHAGYSVIVDATFIRQDLRQKFIDLATALKIPFHIIDCHASQEILRQRVISRSHSDEEVSEGRLEILEHQLKNNDPLTSDELAHNITVDTTKTIDLSKIVSLISSNQKEKND